MEIRPILLCGGASRRFGSNKLLASIPGEESLGPIVARAAMNLRDAVGTPLALVPLGAHELRGVLQPLGCEVVESDRAAFGMGASLAAAVTVTDRADGWIVALGDMPLIAPATIRMVLDALVDGALLAAPVCAKTGVRGHPVGFGAALCGELVALEGDVGARRIVEHHSDQLRILSTKDPGIFVDLDTPGQLPALAAAFRFPHQ